MGCILPKGSRVSPIKGHMLENVAFEEVMCFIAKLPLFRALPHAERPRLANAFLPGTYKSGEEVVRCGDDGDELFVIREGEAFVIIVKDDVQEQVAKLVKGDYFGEAAMLRGEPRNATVVATGRLSTLSINRKRFDDLGLRQYLHFPKRRAVAGNADAVEAEEEDVVVPIDPEIEALLAEAFRKNEKLKQVVSVTDNQILQCAKKCVKLPPVKQGVKIITEGDIGDHLYIVEKGSFHVIQASERTAQSGDRVAKSTSGFVCNIEAGQSFGELALLYGAPRNATVQAAEDSIVWTLGRARFREILRSGADAEIQELAELLLKVELFASLLHDERIAMCEAMMHLHFQEGEDILTENEDGDSFFILIDGTVRIFQKGEAVQDLVANRQRGECPHFGERAIIANEPRNATVRVVSETVTALCIDRAKFHLLLGPLEDLLKQEMEDKKEGRCAKSGIKRRLGARDRGKPPLQKNLESLGLLGCGGFGYVTLEKDKGDPREKLYAMKALNKGYVCSMNMRKSVLNEKSILLMTDSPFIIQLYACYNGPEHLYFLLEVCDGGELYATYHRENLHGSVACAQFYSASTTQAFLHLHERHIIYRDLKPENLLLDKHGMCKLADMGLAKFVIGRTYTTCGTSDYFAPEVLSGVGHGSAVDWWTLGILIYELMSGSCPFESQDPLQTYQKIIAGIGLVKFPKNTFPPAVVNLIKCLCKPEPSSRLPCRVGGYEALKRQIWYEDFDWNALNARTIKPPYVPNGQDEFANFSGNAEDIPPQLPYKEKYRTGWEDGFDNMDDF